MIGAGPAGAALACALAGKYKVALIDSFAEPQQRIGESLVPAARRLLQDMKLIDVIEARNYPAYLGNQSVWGGSSVEVTDFIEDPDSPGWHLDRMDFETTLRRTAVERGARMIAPARMASSVFDGVAWNITFDDVRTLKAWVVVDATGRKAAFARTCGARMTLAQKTVSLWMRLREQDQSPPDAGFSTISSGPEGWWYTAPLGEDRILSLHTDADLVTPQLRNAVHLMARARSDPLLEKLLKSCHLASDRVPQITAAHSARPTHVAGRAWLSVGDASLTLDPLSSRGIFHALYTALVASAEIDAAFEADAINQFDLYANHLSELARSYLSHEALFYNTEQRWPDAPFWKRRHKAFVV